MEITGRIVADAVVRTTKSEKKVTGFTIVINDSYRNKEKERVEIATYIECSYWFNPGIAEYLKKGGLVQLSGRIGAKGWINKDKEPQATLTFHVSGIKLLGKSDSGKLERQDSKSTVKATGTPDGDDLPF